MKKVCVFIGSRANYSSAKPILNSIKSHIDLDLYIVMAGGAVIKKYGNLKNLLNKDGFKEDYKFHNLLEGGTTAAMAKATGLATIEMSSIIENNNIDYLVIIGDRFEMMGIVIAAAYMNIKICHTMGGEVTGTIDESIRHAITKFSHLHFASNEDAKNRIIKMGEEPKNVYNVGCPRMDFVKETLSNDSVEYLSNNKIDSIGFISDIINLKDPFFILSMHPVTTEIGLNRQKIECILNVLKEIDYQTILLWPNPDADTDEISKGIRTFINKNECNWLIPIINLPTEIYIHLMNLTKCLIGNSSSGIREGAFIGTPVLNIGNRQNNRLRGKNVIDVPYNYNKIMDAIEIQINNGHYKSELIYGNGSSGKIIFKALSECEMKLEKYITY